MSSVGQWRLVMRRTPRPVKVLLLCCALGLVINIVLLWKNHLIYTQDGPGIASSFSVGEPRMKKDHRPVVWIYAKQDLAMSHVFTVFDRLDYRLRKLAEPWDVLWSHQYPFGTLKEDLRNLKPHQKVNHFPGTSCFVSKPRLANNHFSFTPKTFPIPLASKQFLEEVERRPDTLWVVKNNKHRGIRIKNPKEINLQTTGTIVQEFIVNPLLIGGRKFDIGIYTLITSVNPLRVYIYQEEILLRFCSKDYQPFNKKDKKRYVVDDNYTPTWEIPLMKPLVIGRGFSHKEALNEVLKQKGLVPDTLWAQTNSMIKQVLFHCETGILNHTKAYATTRNFFELVRFDFVIDDSFIAWLMEVNLSPNLSSAHTLNNRFMYEQVIFNVLNLVGLSRGTEAGLRYNGNYESIMLVNEHDILVPMPMCNDGTCSECKQQFCQLCKKCQEDDFSFTLKTAFLEFVSRRNFQRLIPPQFDSCSHDHDQLIASKMSHSKTKLNNELMEAWFHEKCCQHSNWCT